MFLEVSAHCESEFDGGVGREVGMQDVELVGDFKHLPAAVSDGDEVGLRFVRGPRAGPSVVFDGGAEDVFVGEIDFGCTTGTNGR